MTIWKVAITLQNGDGLKLVITQLIVRKDFRNDLILKMNLLIWLLYPWLLKMKKIA